VAPNAALTEYTKVLSSQRVNSPPRMVKRVCRFSQRDSCGPNQSPNVENSAELSFVDDTNSHHSGRMKYRTQSHSRMVSRMLRLREGS
jgi:hypothetical protein